MKKIFFDLHSGVSGDMLVSALAGLCADPESAVKLIQTIPLNFSARIFPVKRGNIAAWHFDIDAHTHHEDQIHGRHLCDILKIISAWQCKERVRQMAQAVFQRLARAEAAVHGTSIDEIHFHEVGAADSIVDILGSCLLLEHLGIEEILFNDFRFGCGTVRCCHGEIPLPVPAVSELAKGFRFRTTDIPSELVTPTGAAVLTALGRQTGQINGRVIAAARGSGDREPAGIPGYLTALFFEDSTCKQRKENILIEVNLDDMNSQAVPSLQESLFAGGALDVYLTPLIMKKGRPAIKISVLCTDDKKEPLENLLLKNTTSFGLRSITMQKTELPVKIKNFSTSLGEVRVKFCNDREFFKYKFEYCDLAAIAEKHQIAVQTAEQILAIELAPDLSSLQD
ncbi:MAG: TIGR00299 family protein [Spirochaetes bacterium GWF1_41_5]|nr:MAG: TIGR00299 family protein [Spirochaetes bacterium GWF1_41_5]HBE04622.1 nickel pincer cofactor biosynthesis protein LarC [Spirochaetia bacterium]